MSDQVKITMPDDSQLVEIVTANNIGEKLKYISIKSKLASRGNNIIASDGYHTFEELYDHRIELFIALCRSKQGFLYHGDDRNRFGDDKLVWRSHFHSDGSEFEGWFIMGIGKKKGEQITYHLPISRWLDTEFAETFDRAPDWDGHTPADVIERIAKL